MMVSRVVCSTSPPESGSVSPNLAAVGCQARTDDCGHLRPVPWRELRGPDPAQKAGGDVLTGGLSVGLAKEDGILGHDRQGVSAPPCDTETVDAPIGRIGVPAVL